MPLSKSPKAFGFWYQTIFAGWTFLNKTKASGVMNLGLLMGFPIR